MQGKRGEGAAVQGGEGVGADFARTGRQARAHACARRGAGDASASSAVVYTINLIDSI